MTVAPYCSYDEGMFSVQKRALPSLFDVYSEFQTACFHEAGHAVVGYLLGQGCSSLSVRVEYSIDSEGRPHGLAYGGMARMSRAAMRWVNQDLRVGQLTSALVNYGVSVAAGPAAERKFRIEAGLPLCALYTAQGDRTSIDAVAKKLEANGRSRSAFQKMVWHRAQSLLRVPSVWGCVMPCGRRTDLRSRFIGVRR